MGSGKRLFEFLIAALMLTFAVFAFWGAFGENTFMTYTGHDKLFTDYGDCCNNWGAGAMWRFLYAAMGLSAVLGAVELIRGAPLSKDRSDSKTGRPLSGLGNQ